MPREIEPPSSVAKSYRTNHRLTRAQKTWLFFGALSVAQTLGGAIGVVKGSLDNLQARSDYDIAVATQNNKAQDDALRREINSGALLIDSGLVGALGAHQTIFTAWGYSRATRRRNP